MRKLEEQSSMDYEKYYESMGNGQPEEKKRRGGRVLLVIFSVILVCGVVCMLVMGLVHSIQQPPVLPERPDFSQTPDVPAATSTPAPTPFATERPMVDFDGHAPVIAQQVNPIPEIVDAVKPSVVGIYNYAEPGSGWQLHMGEEEEGAEDMVQGLGSGFVVSSSGYVLTNAHVVEDAYAVSVILDDGTEIEAEVIGADIKSDVAVLKVDYEGLTPLKLGDSSNLRVGDFVVAIGNPLGLQLGNTVTFGVVSALSRSISIDGEVNVYLQTDAAINVGNSGGPLFNMQGEVIGINTAKTLNAGYDEYGTLITAEGLGFALPINRVYSIAEQLITKGVVKRAALGVQIVSLTKSELRELGLESGVKVHSVVKGAPADIAGIQAGDIIVACDGIAFEDQNGLSDFIQAQEFGARVQMRVWRDGELLTIPVDLVDMNSIDYNSRTDDG